MSAYRTANNQLRTTRILSVATESPTVKTFTFKDKQCAKANPGQFLMLWIPDVDEIPLSIADVHTSDKVSVAVKRVGEATHALHNMKTDDVIGVRGPFGNSFTLKKGHVLLVGGGTGIAPLLFLVRKLKAQLQDLTFVIGAKTKEELLYVEKLETLCKKGNLVATTEDGSYGTKCLATTLLEALFKEKQFDMVYTCGPEMMMWKVFELAEKSDIMLEASLERLMRCAIGLCGSCIIGKYRVCRDGPVFSGKQLSEVRPEFGVSKLDFNGRRIPL